MYSIEISKEFSTTPGGRFKVMGPKSGEEFREVIKRALTRKPLDTVEVVLDGVEGYGSSFLEEAFGGLVRSGTMPVPDILDRLRVVARSPAYQTYVVEAKQYIAEAIAKLNG